ncbi:MAG: ATP-binding cassette domain-containing protein [Candidatus Riflebacteria bacterium]|jgi:ABC-2 type transport system ATP-binding protein|nr:ATP-binding cassette domain-containing protein [Candidatus Riflebacteria bacterium]
MLVMINSTSETAIVTRQLSRRFSIRLKSEGLAASFRNFFSPVYKTVNAVVDLDMCINRGEIIGFLGPNGAGKTTTLKMLSGLLVPSAGSIEVLGFNPFNRDHEFLKSISLVMGQKQNLWWDLPPQETFEIHRRIYGLSDEQYRTRIDELVDMLEIGDCLETQTRKLSLGQRMRCELAVSLLHQPAILFLDEPTIGLDILMQKKIRTFLLDYHRRFKPTILLTSHYMDDVAALAQRVIVINNGGKIFDGRLRELTDRMRPEKIMTVIINNGEFPCQLREGCRLIHREGQLFRFLVNRELVGELAACLYSTGQIADLTIEDAPLEEIIGQLFTAANASAAAITVSQTNV